MKPIVKVISVSLAGLLLPVCLVVGLSKYFSAQLPSATSDMEANKVSNPQGEDRPALGAAKETLTADAAADESDREELERASAVVDEKQSPSASVKMVNNLPGLNPQKDKIFLLAFTTRFPSLPTRGARHKVISKYNTAENPNSGWAFALARFPTSIRPEIYWKDTAGRGGWLTFDNTPLRKAHLYSFVLLAKPGNYLSLYMQDVSAGADARTENGGNARDVTFLGGIPIEQFSNVATPAPLAFGGSQNRRNVFQGDIREMLVAQLDELPRRAVDLSKLLTGGANEIAGRIPADQRELWIDSSGQDKGKNSLTLQSAKDVGA